MPRDRQYPGLEAGVPTEAAEAAPGEDERVLGGIFGLGVRPQGGQRGPIHSGSMPIDEIPEGGVIPVAGARHQLGIGHTSSRHGDALDGWVFNRIRATEEARGASAGCYVPGAGGWVLVPSVKNGASACSPRFRQTCAAYNASSVRPRSLTVVAAVLQLSATHLASAQQIGASRTVLATVMDNRGRSMVDIEADDFVVRETGQLRDVLSVRVADYPLAVVIDNGQGAGRDFESIRQAAGRFIGRVGRRPVAVALSDPPGLVATFEDDRAIVLQRLQQATATSSSDGLFQAIVTVARALQETGSPFSAIIVVSAAPVSTVPTEVLTPILESGASVHVVVHRQAATAPGQSSEALRALADETHGQFTTIFAAASYQVALDRLADRIAPELLVDYVVPVGSSHGNDVSVGVRIPGSRVEARGVTR